MKPGQFKNSCSQKTALKCFTPKPAGILMDWLAGCPLVSFFPFPFFFLPEYSTFLVFLNSVVVMCWSVFYRMVKRIVGEVSKVL